MISNPLYIVLTLVALVASNAVGAVLRRRFAEHSQEGLPYSGAEVARKMLADNGIDDVEVVSVPGQLTDHYNPAKKTVNLSEAVCYQRNVAAAAVAAHECGHAVQHARAYSMLALRSALVPVVSLSAHFMQWVLLVGILMAASGNTTLLWIGVIMFASTTLFSLVTLPVEFDASRRAMAWMGKSGLVDRSQHEKAKNALWWAAMTYVVAALASVGQLIFYLQYLRGASRN